MNIDETDNSPEAGAARFWHFLTSPDTQARETIGGLLHPRTLNRVAEIISDFDTLESPRLAAELSDSTEPSVKYAEIIAMSEGGTALPARYLTLKWEETLKYWAVYRYGDTTADPASIPA